jgi:prepilin peptidase CpaA
VTTYQIAAVIIAALAVVSDLRTRRIPNVLTFGAAIAAVVARGLFDGIGSAGVGLAGWAVGVAIFFPVFALGGMGAGDIKLLGAIGALLGPLAALWVCLFTGVAGGVMGIAVALWTGYFSRALSNIYGLLMFWRVSGVQPAPDLVLESHNGPRLAYAVPVFAGLMAAIWLR